MGQNSRARREAKQRERRRREQARAQANPRKVRTLGSPHAAARASGGAHTGFDPAPPRSEPPEPAPEDVDQLLARLARAMRYSGGVAAEPLLDRLIEIDAAHPELLDRQLRSALANSVRAAFGCGWLPLDVVEQARRRLDERVRPFLLDAIIAEHSGHSAAGIDSRWQAQVDDLVARQTHHRDGPLLTQWVDRNGASRRQALRGVVSIVGFCVELPPLPRLLPLPGAARAGQRTAHSSVDHKMLSRIRSLLAKAESTEFAGEADALSAKAQELMAKFSLDRALVEAGAETIQPLDTPTARRIWLDAPYVSAKTNLVGGVARANGCRAITAGGLDFVTVVGRETDLELVELLVTSLLVQASREMLRAGSQVTARGRSTTRSYRHSFLVSYAVRIGERLRAATQSAHDNVDDTERLPVLAARERQVDETFTELFPHRVARRVSASSATGWHHGRTAADLATLHTGRPIEEG